MKTVQAAKAAIEIVNHFIASGNYGGCPSQDLELVEALIGHHCCEPEPNMAAVHITTNARFQYERSEHLVAQSAADIAEWFASEPDLRQQIHKMLLERLAPILSQNNALWERWDEMMSAPQINDPHESHRGGSLDYSIAAGEERRRAATAKLEAIRHKEERVRAWIPQPEPAV